MPVTLKPTTASNRHKCDVALGAHKRLEAINKQIADLQRAAATLKAERESAFPSDRYTRIDCGSGFVLTREQVTVTPTEIPAPYSYWRYSLTSK